MKDFFWRLPAVFIFWGSAICGGLLLHYADPNTKIALWFGVVAVALTSTALSLTTIYLTQKVKMHLGG